MNELPAVVQGPDAVAVAGHTVTTPAAAQRASGDRVLFLVRPEDMALGNGDGKGLPGSVTARTFQGAATILGVRLDAIDTLVSVHTSGSAATHLSPGDRVNVVIDGTRGVVETPAEA
jgi:ABC-type Fe3+/spermidine/putrescine transport system ATPase subunit